MASANKTIPMKIEDLDVLFVSGVRSPATGERFLMMKDVKGAAFQDWARGLRAQKPEVAEKMDTLLVSGEHDALRALVKAEGGDAMVQQLDVRLKLLGEEVKNMNDYDQIEPTEKEMLDLPDVATEDLIEMIAYKRDWSNIKREEHKKSGGYFAGGGTSYPLKTCADVHPAYMSAGRVKGKDPETVRKNVVSWAKEHHCTGSLPETVRPANKAGLGTSVITSLANAAGLEVVPSGTLDALKKIREAIDITEKSIAGGPGAADDDPVQAVYRLLNNVISQPPRAPSTPRPARTPGADSHDEQPNVLKGTPFDGSVRITEEGTPFPGSHDERGVTYGTPAVKNK